MGYVRAEKCPHPGPPPQAPASGGSHHSRRAMRSFSNVSEALLLIGSANHKERSAPCPACGGDGQRGARTTLGENGGLVARARPKQDGGGRLRPKYPWWMRT